MNTTLDNQQLEQYERDGYVVLKGLFSAAELARFDRHFQSLVAAGASGAELPEGMKLMKDVMVVKGVVSADDPVLEINKLLAFENDETLFAYACKPELLAAVASMVGDQPYVIASNVFNKPPEVDGRHPLHQDLRYFRLRPADKIVGCWTAISPANRANGCLAVIPGSHKGPLLEHKDPDWEFVNYAFFGVDTDQGDKRVHVEMEPGDTLLFHTLLIHGSGHNATDQCRRAISVHYAHADLVTPDAREHSRARQAAA